MPWEMNAFNSIKRDNYTPATSCYLITYHSIMMYSGLSMQKMYFLPPRDILREIQRLRLEQEQAAKASPDPQQPRNPTLLAELRLLRQRRDELEGRMSALQESRRELMVQLEGLMKLLKVRALWFLKIILMI